LFATEGDKTNMFDSFQSKNPQTNPLENNNLDPEKSNSNPFLDSYKELNENQPNEFKEMMDLFASMSGNGNGNEDMKNVSNVYDLLGKLSDNSQLDGSQEHMQTLFQELMEVLLKSNLLEVPLNQIKELVRSHIEKNSTTLTTEDKGKYESTLNYIETILIEIKKPEPNKSLILEMFNKLHELSDFDNNLLAQASPELKDFSNIFGTNFNKQK
jgi:hypothetical protein